MELSRNLYHLGRRMDVSRDNEGKQTQQRTININRVLTSGGSYSLKRTPQELYPAIYWVIYPNKSAG